MLTNDTPARQPRSGPQRVTLSVRIPETHAEHIDRLAAERGQTRSYVAAALIAAALDKVA
jgi:predicted transcriptional regulator